MVDVVRDTTGNNYNYIVKPERVSPDRHSSSYEYYTESNYSDDSTCPTNNNNNTLTLCAVSNAGDSPREFVSESDQNQFQNSQSVYKNNSAITGVSSTSKRIKKGGKKKVSQAHNGENVIRKCSFEEIQNQVSSFTCSGWKSN